MTVASPVALALLVAAALAPLGAAPSRTREPALAGSWYPDSKAFVALEVHWRLRGAAAAPTLAGRPIALVVPHAGWRYSGLAAGAAFRTLRRGDFGRVVIVAPSHFGAHAGFAIDDAQAYRTPLGSTPVCADPEVREFARNLTRVDVNAADREHAIEIELPFLQETLGDFCLVPILAGRAAPEQERALAQGLARLHDGKTLFVVSSDFTHYGPRFGYTPFGPSAVAARDKIRAQDRRAVQLLARQDAAGFREFQAETGATICGHAGLAALLELLPIVAPQAKATLLAHYTSGDLPEARDDSSVDYVALAFTREDPASGAPLTGPPDAVPVGLDQRPLDRNFGQRLVRLARAALATELLGADDLRRELAAYPRGPEFERLQAAFVTLNRTLPEEVEAQGRLRGCIGQVAPTYPLYAAVTVAAVNAALHDRRFPPVEPAELKSLAVEVTVLSPPRPVGSWTDIRLGQHGIVLDKDGRSALFLPQVPGEQGWTLEDTLNHLAAKAGLPADAWREGARFSVFTGQVFHEGSQGPGN